LLATFPGSFPDTLYTAVAIDANNQVYGFALVAGGVGNITWNGIPIAFENLIRRSPDGKILANWKNIFSKVNKDASRLGSVFAVDGNGSVYI
jgi:hypothetical protein